MSDTSTSLDELEKKHKHIISSRTHRSRIQIVIGILNKCDGTLPKTSLMYRSFTSWEQLNAILPILIKHNLIEENNLGKYIKTDKANRLLSLLYNTSEGIALREIIELQWRKSDKN